jgi:TRAP-type C4-dicarboxylate transport system substrate-binding protein
MPGAARYVTQFIVNIKRQQGGTNMMTFFKNSLRAGLVGALALVIGAGSAFAASWDMPTPYPDATFHTANIHKFAEDVKAATNGDLTIKVHSAGSLFKHKQIKKAVRSG